MGIEALKAYLAIRGSAETDHVFIYRHQPLKVGYCGRRLRFHRERCGLHVTPHQLRFSCATLLLNAGTPILTVQRILGHQRVETTLRYAGLYDSTIATDYSRAMVEVEDSCVIGIDQTVFALSKVMLIKDCSFIG